MSNYWKYLLIICKQTVSILRTRYLVYKHQPFWSICICCFRRLVGETPPAISQQLQLTICGICFSLPWKPMFPYIKPARKEICWKNYHSTVSDKWISNMKEPSNSPRALPSPLRFTFYARTCIPVHKLCTWFDVIKQPKHEFPLHQSLVRFVYTFSTKNVHSYSW